MLSHVFASKSNGVTEQYQCMDVDLFAVKRWLPWRYLHYCPLWLVPKVHCTRWH